MNKYSFGKSCACKILASELETDTGNNGTKVAGFIDKYRRRLKGALEITDKETRTYMLQLVYEKNKENIESFPVPAKFKSFIANVCQTIYHTERKKTTYERKNTL